MAKRNLLLSLCVLCLALTRSIGFAAFFAIALFFLMKGQWKNFTGFIISFVIIIAGFELLRFFIWKNIDVNFSMQIRSLLSKDYYNPALGKENLMGFIHRFKDNSNLFFSNYLYTNLGIENKSDYIKLHPALTILTYLMFSSLIIFSFRRNNYIFFSGLYMLVFCLITFFIAHSFWGQNRFIIPYLHLIMLVLLSLIYFILLMKHLKSFQWIFPILLTTLLILTIRTTVPAVISARMIVDEYYGLTPDQKNYCKISEWASVHLPKNSIVACRKPTISFIYGHGKKFAGITNVPFSPGDSVLIKWKQMNVHYAFIPASQMDNRMVSENLFYTFKKGIVAYGIINNGNAYNVRFYAMNFPDSTARQTLRELNQAGIYPVTDLDSLNTMMKKENFPILVIFPDTLVKILYKAKASHVLMANLRFQQYEKSEMTINTVERFMKYVEFKYPGFSQKIMQIGADDEEPASVYQLNWDKCGLILAP